MVAVGSEIARIFKDVGHELWGGHNRTQQTKAKSSSQLCNLEVIHNATFFRLLESLSACKGIRLYPLPLAGAAIFVMLSMVAPRIANAQTESLAGNRPAFDVTAMHTRANTSRPLIIHISFAPRNPAGLSKLLADLQDPASPRYHRWLSQAEFGSRFGRSPDEVAAVRQWVSARGFRVVESSDRGITSVASVAQAESAFATALVASPDGSLYTNASDPQIPSRFAGIIGSIEGLDNLRHSVPMAIIPSNSRVTRSGTGPHRQEALRNSDQRRRDPYSAALVPAAIIEYSNGLGPAFGPADLWTFYDETPLLSAGTDGSSGDCIAVVEDTDYYAGAVSLFNSNFSLPVANLTRVLADGSNPGKNGDEIEALLDIEWTHAVAPGAAISVYIGNPAAASVDPLVDAMRKAVNDNKCGTISVSYGYCGASSAFFTKTLDPIFAQAAAQGQSVFISSGDQGAAGIVLNASATACVAGTSRNVSEMSADPNVIAVGGTEFTPVYDSSNNDIGDVAENAWNDGTGAGGGGASTVFSKPAWQASGTPADGKRDVPDIAFGASPISPGFYWGDDHNHTGSAVITCCIGGTSIAAPMWAGLATLIAQDTGGRLGNMNPRIYTLGALYDASVSGLRDVTAGDNSFNYVSGFTAVPGYDQSTGWGTADMAAFAAAYPSSTPTPTPTPTATPTPTPTPAIGPASLSARRLLFGRHKVGTVSRARMVTILNRRRNKAPLIIGSVSLNGSNFVIDSATTTCNSGAGVVPGSRCRIGVRFEPVASGRQSDTLTIVDNSSNGPHLVSLKGRGM
jgi:subtilase family serine protease